MIIGLLSARYRDVPYVVSYVLQFFMFVSPIFWNPTMLEKGGWFVDWNPIYHWIAVVRDPILGATSTPASLWFCIATAVIGMGVAFAAFAASSETAGAGAEAGVAAGAAVATITGAGGAATGAAAVACATSAACSCAWR